MHIYYESPCTNKSIIMYLLHLHAQKRERILLKVLNELSLIYHTTEIHNHQPHSRPNSFYNLKK